MVRASAMCCHHVYFFTECEHYHSDGVDECWAAKQRGSKCNRKTWSSDYRGSRDETCAQCYLDTPPDTPLAAPSDPVWGEITVITLD
jgi:hypothetical protein